MELALSTMIGVAACCAGCVVPLPSSVLCLLQNSFTAAPPSTCGSIPRAQSASCTRPREASRETP
eukprot:6099863-Karenia_brevis.AAC.1